MSNPAKEMNLIPSLAPVAAGTLRVFENSPHRLCGIFTRQERWGLSWRGRLLAGGFLMLGVMVLVLGIHPFLAVTQRMNANSLVVEGWVHEFAICAAAEEFKASGYERVYTTGGPVPGSGGYTTDYNTSANIGASRLRKAGIATESVQMVASHVIGRDRTYNSAIALRDWLREHNAAVGGVNVVTEAAHARRTRLLFQEAFGKEVAVGIIAVPNPDYDARHWWRYSEGVREVTGETIAYLYAKLLFHPGGPKDGHRE